MINTRIEVDTSSSPFKVKRNEWEGGGRPPALLQPYLSGKNDWLIFCDRIDLFLDSRGGLEEIKAIWMILGVITTILLVGIVAGIIVTAVIVKGTTLPIVMGCLLAGLFVVFVIYFILMQKLVVKSLRDFAKRVDEYCAEVSQEKSNNAVTFRFQMNVNKCKLYWDRDFKCWIDVSTMDPIELGTGGLPPGATQENQIEMGTIGPR
mmetsp:Transcript_24787/g.58813  ORF Transcript_24787/g.58813 Transcript_24787/m.58813 type:complete len:206 (-) Transcript_24787:638-1255(-)